MFQKISKKISDFNTPKLLIGILFLAAVLRFQGIFWGIPVFDSMVQSYHPDEPKILNGAYNFPYHILSNTDLCYPTFYHYFLGTFSLPVKLIFKISGWSSEAYILFITIFSRFISIVLGLGSIFLTFVLAKKLYNEKVGLLSALFISLSLYHVQNSSWATLDVANSFFLVLTIYFAYKMYGDPIRKFYLLTGASLGILIGTKYNGFVVVIFILILHYYRTLKSERKISDILQASFSKNLWMLFLFAGIVFLLTTPTIILKPAAFTDSISELLNRGPGRKYSFIFDYSIFTSVIKNFVVVTDPFLTILMILGLIIPFRKYWDREIPMITIVIIFSIFFGALSSRQLIAVLPLTSILSAQGVFYLYKRINFIHKPVWVSFLILWIIFALVYNSAGIVLRNNDTRTKAAYYIKKNISMGSTIGATSIGNYKRWNWMFPKIDEEKYKVIDALKKPEFIILTSYDFVKMEEALLSDKLHNYKWDTEFSKEMV